VDDEDGFRDPRGMYGQRLGVDMHFVMGGIGPLRNLAHCIERCHLDISSVTVSPYAAGLGVLTDDERDYLARVADIFGFTESEFARIKAAHVGRDADDPYLILAVDEDVSDEDLKRAYRRAAAANHPDRLVARGLPPEMTALATHKMAMINRAYNQIRQARKRRAAILL
jgi:hypothetical protein